MFKERNVLKKNKENRLVIVCMVLTLLSYIFLGYINQNEVLADQVRESYSDKISRYPGYKELIDNLKKNHPSWQFTIFYTGLDWNQVIKNETTVTHGRNVVPSYQPSAWRCSVCGNTPRGGNSWRCASEAAVCYYMDPRNWLNDTYIFQFENLSFNSTVQTLDGVKKIIAGIQYMQGDNITYTTTNNTQATLGKSYAQVIFEAAQDAKISPYHLASRIRQEQGAGANPGDTAKGTYSGYVGYYNFLNIGSTGDGDTQITVNGLKKAQENGWTNPEISIKEGAKALASNYINIGQDTLYLQKFDVDSSNGSSLYYHQYMQNVSAAVSESTKPRQTYQDLGVMDSNFEFIIPVYENMPDTICTEPSDATIVTQNVKVKGMKVNVRNGASTSSSIIATVNTGDTLLRIQKASSTNGGYYWDKIVLPNGQKGYIARTYLVDIADITNCNDTVIVNTTANLRNGPGLTDTTVIVTLTQGQVLTRIEKGQYNLDGYVWDRVKLADGRQGYIAQKYIGLNDNTGGNTSQVDIVKVVCEHGVKVRQEPGTNTNILAYLDKGDIATRTQAGVSSAEGYTWDKIVTTSGVEGYIARGDSKEAYIEVVSSNVNPDTTPKAQNNNFKLEDTNLICEPDTTVESIKEKYSDTAISVKKADGTEVTDGNIGTGCTITIGDKSYTVVKLGDTNGDGRITPADATVILRAYVGTATLSDTFQMAIDANKDKTNTPADATIVLRAYVGLTNIEI